MFDAAEIYLKRINPLIEMAILEEGYESSPGLIMPDKRDLVEALRQSLILLPVAFFEEFLRNLFQQFVDNLNGLNPRLEWRDLPLSLTRAHVFETSLVMRKKPSDGDDLSYQMNCIADLKNIIDKIVSPLTKPTAYIIAEESFTNTNSNPDSNTVKEMFDKIGIKKLFQQQELITEMSKLESIYSNGESIRLKLNEVVDLRHGVAHGRQPLSMTRTELVNNIIFLQYFASSLQKLAQLSFISLEQKRIPS